ncbi:hypothetical protein N3K66_008427 [Trichothecium roseum]|uniref:Uncharacterized protein n=1 Tax=Trichothecium roseum TaxID=47278 RepID=A0ACC0UQ69_9HYPO|nr:hypothetical protein N3K66_008427 [Trichothecium roseum]
MSPWMHIRIAMSAPTRRDSQSSQSGSSFQRPKLLRSNATEPSVSSSDTARASLTTSPHRAAELLNKVVYIPSAYDGGEHHHHHHHHHAAAAAAAAPEKLCRRTTERYMMDRRDSSSSQPATAGATMMGDSYSGSYFSFPSFDVWEQPKEAEEDER